ncbi:MAG: hypothetical protein COA91_03330 [Robiginitomaculum sp.]|nr:MAG: hypothetical protein COA91_03330 [Robiginitomaculum sp.]
MNDNKSTTDKNITKILIKAPIETVWAELIKTNAPLPFFFGSVCKTTGLKAGAPIRMQSPNGKNTAVAGTITIFEPPYRYGHSFQFTNLDDPPCHVTYELKETVDGTEFSLIQEGAIPGSKTEKSMSQGAPFIVENLKSLVETGKVTGKGRMILLMIKLMGPFSPKVCRSANWPMEREI